MSAEREHKDKQIWDGPIGIQRTDELSIYQRIVQARSQQLSAPPIIRWNFDQDELWANDPIFEPHEPLATQSYPEPEATTNLD